MSRPTMSEKTTIAIDLKVQKELNKLRKGRETYNDVVKRLIHGISDVYMEFVLVDNELPQSHTVVFQLGEDTKSLYRWNGENVRPITLEETQKLLKQPKSNITITREEAKMVENLFSTFKQDFGSIVSTQPLLKRLRGFLSNE